jgi:hypothetical protein
MKNKGKGTGLKPTKYGTVLYTRKYKKRKRPSIHEDQPVFYPDRKRESNNQADGLNKV